MSKERKVALSIKSHGAPELCRKITADESQSPQTPIRDVVNNAEIGSQVLTLQQVGGGLQNWKQIDPPESKFENGRIQINSVPLSTGSPSKTIFRVTGSNHYFNGDLYIITDAEVSKERVLGMLWASLAPAGEVENIVDAANAVGWMSVSGINTLYRTIRYTHIYSFLDNGSLYFLVQEPLVNLLRQKVPAFVLLELHLDGSLTNRCEYMPVWPRS